MFDKLEGLVDRLDTVLQELNDPDVAGNQNRFRDLMKEQNELTPIVEKYKEYKAEKQNIEDSLMLLEEESDEEMKELAKEELNESKANVERLEEELKILLIPRIQWMTRISSLRCVPVPVEMKLGYSSLTLHVCIEIMQKANVGK